MTDPQTDRWLNRLPRVKGVHHEEIELRLPIDQAAAGVAGDKGTVLLLSGSDLDCSRYHILAVNPWLEITSKQDQVSIVFQGCRTRFRKDVFETVQSVIDRCRMADAAYGLPVACGLFGYLAYDLKDRIEVLPRTCVDTGLPDLYLCAPGIVLIQDRMDKRTHLCIPVLEYEDGTQLPDREVGRIRDTFLQRLDVQAAPGRFAVKQAALNSSFTKQEYVHAVNRIIRYLKAGDIYQANLSQRFETGFSGDSYALFIDLFRRNPASFFAYVNAGDHTVVSTSPERFIKQDGRAVETRPIKGTIARGRTREQDRQNRISLSDSVKDDAELTMIVDLMRNDLSRVTAHGSVIVTEHKRLEPYENVYHLVSIVEGRLKRGCHSVDLIKATFPGGSITGCPKIRSMEIIDELEPVKRHVYTGSIGYISFHDTMDLSIAIRTATIFKDKVFFSVGGGIVYDSDPEKEYQETLDKGKTLMESLAGSRKETAGPVIKAWVNGKMTDPETAGISATSPGFQYGAGVFETIKVSGGRICFLPEHLDRMNRAWRRLFDRAVPDICWESVIRLLIRENEMEREELAVKLVMARESADNIPDVFLAAFLRPYVHRLDILDKPGLDLVTFPHPRQSVLADYKTLNYLVYDLAGAFAREQGADEALILNPDGTVSETNTANIIAVDKNRVVVPQSPQVLNGVVQQQTLHLLEQKGYEIVKQTVSTEALCGFANVILTNSLMGAVKVMRIDGKEIAHDADICSAVNHGLFHRKSNKQGEKE